MRIILVTPAPAGSLKGNWVTAERWARRLEELGHEPVIVQRWTGGDADLLVALHAAKSFESIRRYRDGRPRAPLVVVLTGTDVYGDIGSGNDTLRSLEMADRIVVLQPAALDRLPPELRAKAKVIRQSAVPPQQPEPPAEDAFEVCVLAHLREVKDPLRAALAARLLPPTSRLVVVHAGEAIDSSFGEQAAAETKTNPRYRWLGGMPHEQALRLLARSRLLILTSLREGGANVVSEAMVCGVPVLSSRIAGSVGMLGDDYPGYFPVGDERALADLMSTAETDPALLADLRSRVDRLQPLYSVAAERDAWSSLLTDLAAA